MKLLLHIGTHKTATTSIQHFLTLNRENLAAHGFLYPENDDSAYVFNFLASRIAFGKSHEVEQFLSKTINKAKEKNCHTVVISAESFYAMTGFFIDIQKRARSEDYWTHEARLIELLKGACANFTEITIACYLRPQDELAASLYNQLVKNTHGITSSYEDFLSEYRELYDYQAHIGLWAKIFGKGSIHLKNFQEIKQDVIGDFCRSFLTEGCFTKADLKSFEANTRLNRDVLEVKRLYNATAPDPALAYISARSFRKINDLFPDEKGYQIFAPPQVQQDFFRPFEQGNTLLSKDYGLSALRTYSDAGEPTYPGLTAEKTAKIYLKFCDDLYTPRNRLELFARRTARWIMNKIPGGRVALLPLRKLHNTLRLKIAGW